MGTRDSGYQDAYTDVIETLQAAIGVLELPPHDLLWRDVQAICTQAHSPYTRVVVFGPFNYGKSTLLNAMLGERALPIDLIPTTGAAIAVRYGPKLATRIRLTNGTQLDEPGTEILKRFAILDGDRRMRDDVASVEVFCPHPWLQTGVELMDLPGTDDQVAQDALVKDQLLTADLVVQVLDGRKLMTLGEREHLRDWLLDRGIETVVFVVNFLNLLEPEEQKQVYNRLRFVAESFRAKLPVGVSNLYRVDALPALRARLKGNMAEAQASGLPMFESALQTIVQNQQSSSEARLPRLRAIAQRVQTALQTKLEAITADLAAEASKHNQKIQLKQQAATLIQQGFAKNSKDFATWLSLTHLLACYQEELATALQAGTFKTWVMGDFKRTAIDHQQAIVKWVNQACEFFDREKTHQFLVNFPPDPQVEVIPPTTSEPPKKKDLPPEAIAGGAIGFMLGGPVGAVIAGGASYLLNKTLESDRNRPDPPPAPVNRYPYLEAAREFLVDFSAMNLAALQRYEKMSDRLLQYHSTDERSAPSLQSHQHQLIQATLERLQTALERLT